MNLAQMRGLRFPDDYVLRFFFKTGCDQRVGNVLELGCASGNNLMLFYHFGWNVLGVDKSRQGIEDALHNFEPSAVSGPDFDFVRQDLSRLPEVLPQSLKVPPAHDERLELYLAALFERSFEVYPPLFGFKSEDGVEVARNPEVINKICAGLMDACASFAGE